MNPKGQLPDVQVSFAPTKAYVGAFGQEDANKQAKVFTAPTWARNLVVPGEETDEDTEEEEPRVRMKTPEEMARDKQLLVLMGTLFLSGAVIGLLVSYRLGYLGASS